MAKYIPFDKMKTLREAARNGDENARKILNMQLSGEEDYSELLDSYFAPKAEAEPQPQEEKKVETVVSGDVRLNKFLADNGITKESPEYDAAVKEFYAEVGGGEEDKQEEGFESIIQDLMKEESKAIDDYSKAITKLMNMSELDEKQVKRAIARFEEIRNDEVEHFNELKALLKSGSVIEEEQL